MELAEAAARLGILSLHAPLQALAVACASAALSGADEIEEPDLLARLAAGKAARSAAASGSGATKLAIAGVDPCRRAPVVWRAMHASIWSPPCATPPLGRKSAAISSA